MNLTVSVRIRALFDLKPQLPNITLFFSIKMASLSQKTVEFSIKNRILVLVLSLLFSIGLAAGASKFKLANDYRVFFSKDNPDLLAFEKLEKVYSKNDAVFFIIKPKEGKLFTKENLEALKELTEKAWQTPFSQRVDSITNFQHTYSEEDDLIVEDLIPDGEITPEIISRAEKVSTSDPSIYKRLIAGNKNVATVVVRINLKTKKDELIFQISKYTRDLKDEIQKKYPNLEIHLTGLVMLNNAFAEAPIRDSKLIIPLMVFILCLSMYFFLGSFIATFATLLLVGVSAAAATGLCSHLGISFDPVSASAPTIILTLAIADAIHIITTYISLLSQGQSKNEAILNSFKINSKAVFLTSITTAVGFLSLNFGDSPPFRHLGNITAFGIMLAWLFAMTMLPALLACLPTIKAKSFNFSKNISLSAAEFTIKNYKLLLISTALITIVSVSLAFQLKFDDKYYEYFDHSTQFRRSSDFALKEFGGVYGSSISLESGAAQGVNDPAFLKKVEAFTNHLRGRKNLDHVYSIIDLTKRLNKNLHGDDSNYYKLPESKEEAAQYLFLYEMSLPFGLDVNDLINVDKSSTKVSIIYGDITTPEYIIEDNNIKKWLEENGKPEITSFTHSGTGMMFTRLTRRNINSMILGTSIGFFLIALILAYSLKSIRLGIVSLIPNIMPSAIAFGIWYLAVGTAGFAISVVASLSIGIIVDDTVHFLSKFKYAREVLNQSADEAIRYTFKNVGTALIGTSIIIASGFTILGFSSFRITAYMGILTSLSIIAAFFADFLLLPALLLYLAKRKDLKNTNLISN